MIGFTDERITELRVTRWSQGEKELRLVVDVPKPPHSTVLTRMPQIEHQCLWALTGQTQGYGGHKYHQVVGRWGPFLHSGYVALEPSRPKNNPKPKMSAQDWFYQQVPEDTYKPPRPDVMGEFLDGEVRGLWRGIGYGCRDLDLGEERFVEISYSATQLQGNGFQTNIEATYLEALLERFGIDWVLLPNEHQNSVAKAEPRVRKPHACGEPRLYLNAHNKKTFGAHLPWMVDDHGRREELFFGAYWPSEAALQKAINEFTARVLAAPPRNIYDTRKLITVIHNPTVLARHFPDYDVSTLDG